MTSNQKLGAGCLSVVVLLAAVFALGVFKLNSDADHDLKTEIASAKAEGLWIEKASDVLKPVPADQNAAPLYQKAFDIIDRFTMKGGTVHFDSPSERKMFTLYLQNIEPALTYATQATEKPYCNFEHDYDNYAALKFPEFASFRNLARIFSTRAEMEANDGKPELAIQDLTYAAKIAHHAGQGPTLISVLIQAGTDNVVISSLEIILGIAPQVANRAKAVLDALGPPPDALRVYGFEIYLIRKNLDRPFDKSWVGNEDPGNNMRQLVWLSKFPWVRAHWQAAAIKFERKFHQELGKDLSPANQMRTAHLVDEALMVSKNSDDKALQIFMPTYGEVFAACERDIAYRALAAQAVAILSSGKIPDQLPLKGTAAEDPYNHKPLNYRTKKVGSANTGFIIYAVSRSGKTHGGARQGIGISAEQADIVFEYPYKLPPRIIKPVDHPVHPVHPSLGMATPSSTAGSAQSPTQSPSGKTKIIKPGTPGIPVQQQTVPDPPKIE